MLKKIEKYIYVASVFVCLLWFLADSGLYRELKCFSINDWFPQKGWEPIIAFFAVVTTITGITSIQGRRNWNASLSQKFFEEFPSSGFSVPFLKNHNMGDPFHENSLKEIERFLDDWDDAEHEFLDNKAENIKKEFYSRLATFYENLSLNIYPQYQEGMFSMEIKDFESNQNKLEKMKELNKMAHELYDKHQNLTRRLLSLITA
jgi:hypothetical protein